MTAISKERVTRSVSALGVLLLAGGVILSLFLWFIWFLLSL